MTSTISHSLNDGTNKRNYMYLKMLGLFQRKSVTRTLLRVDRGFPVHIFLHANPNRFTFFGAPLEGSINLALLSIFIHYLKVISTAISRNPLLFDL